MASFGCTPVPDELTIPQAPTTQACIFLLLPLSIAIHSRLIPCTLYFITSEMKMRFPISLLALLPFIYARSDPWAEEYAGTPDLSFSGITTFAHLPHERCLDNIEGAVDVAILGVPYDNAVSYRPGMFLLYSRLPS